MSDRLREQHLIRPDWPAPDTVGALSTTRAGGVSTGPWESLNLGTRCGDDPDHVAANRARLSPFLPAAPLWMKQVHGTRVIVPDDGVSGLPEADARVESVPGRVVAIMTADCLPVLLCDEEGRQVAAAHAGWRGLAGGVIEATVEHMNAASGRLMAWLGPAIGGAVYEVGEEVRDAFANAPGLAGHAVDQAFTRAGDRWLLDVSAAAGIILDRLGVGRVFGGGFCTYRESGRFFSHRRDGVTGRMASLIWLQR